MSIRIRTLAILVLLNTATLSVVAQPTFKKQLNTAEILQGLHKLNTVSSVLYVAAHPDDENTRLIAYLANGLHARTGYLSMTRGDGGQNLVGTEKGALMGVLRTQELLEARRIDGGEQFFTRANDFGYSKTPEETFEIWNKDSVLADVVLTIRRFKPDIIITRFPTDGRGGHGHHTASALLADEAFDLAADPNYNPWSIKVPPHTTKRLLVNVSSWWNPNIAEDAKKDDGYLTVDVGEYNPLLGKSYMEIASESRSMHKSQGFGSGKTRGSNIEYLYHVKGEKATDGNLFSGITTTWDRIPEAKSVTDRIDRCFKAFSPENPKLIAPFLLQIYQALDKLEDTENWAKVKKQEAKHLLLECIGLWTEATSDDYRYAYNNDVKVTAEAIVRSTYPVTLEKVTIGNNDTATNAKLTNNEQFAYTAVAKAPASSTTPYWLQNGDFFGLYHVNNPLLIGKPQNDAPLTVEFRFNILGTIITVTEPVVYKWVDRVDGELYRPVVVAPAITANIQKDVYLFTGSEEKEIKVKLKANQNGASGSLLVDLPEGWSFHASGLNNSGQNPFIPVVLKEKGAEKDIVLTVTPKAGSKGGDIKVKLMLSGATEYSSLDFTEVKYPHIQTQVVMQESQAKLINLALETSDKRIGYIMGAGDDVPDNLREIGYKVELINPEELSSYELNKYQVIIAGIRAYNTRDALMANNYKLMEFVKNGGTYIVQYNTSGRWEQLESIGPYPFKISRDRVTKEDAPATLLKNDVLKKPNKIEDVDFNGWVQERGLYFAQEWDKKYKTAIEWNDPGEAPQQGALLIGEYGSGVFMYTGISFFRELPAGVSGAYKLLVNMIEYE